MRPSRIGTEWARVRPGRTGVRGKVRATAPPERTDGLVSSEGCLCFVSQPPYEISGLEGRKGHPEEGSERGVGKGTSLNHCDG